MIKKWIEIYRALFVRVGQMIVNVDASWQQLADEEQAPGDFKKAFVYPFIVLCMLCTLIGALIGGGFHAFLPGLVHTLFAGVALFCGFWISRMVCMKTTEKFYDIKLDDVQTDKIVGYSFGVIMALKAVMALFSGLFFLVVLSLYVVYMLWDAAETIVKIDEDHRGKFLLFNSISIIGVVFVITWLLEKMVPNI